MDDEQQYRRAPSHLWKIVKLLARQMRHEPTLAEEFLWQRLRRDQINNAHFRRQHTIDRFIVDFYCHAARLIIEVDGEIHQYTVEEDAARQAFLESMGLFVLRFSNDDVLHNIDHVIEMIRSYLARV